MSIQLSDFIELTLLEIDRGVSSARAAAESDIAPPWDYGIKADGQPQLVEFELSVEVQETESSSRESEAKARLSVIGGGLKGAKTQDSQTVVGQSIRFSVPIYLQFHKGWKRPKTSGE